MSELKAVIFDMDGVLIDSEQRNMRLWREINEEFGNVLDLSILPYMMGGSPEENYARFKDRLPHPETYALMKAERKKRGDALIEKEGMPLKPGVLEMLETLEETGLRRLIASSTPRESALHMLELAGIAGRFNGDVFGDEAGRRKPHPDLYLTIMEHQGLTPEACVIIEDSPNGVRAGHAAGVRVLGIPDTVSLDEFRDREAYRIFSSMEEARQWILEEIRNPA